MLPLFLVYGWLNMEYKFGVRIDFSTFYTKVLVLQCSIPCCNFHWQAFENGSESMHRILEIFMLFISPKLLKCSPLPKDNKQNAG